jgi:dienelactone hydrolase
MRTVERAMRQRAAASLPALALILGLACASERPLDLAEGARADAPGTPLSIEHLDSYRSLTLKTLVWWVGLSEQLPVRHGIDRYRLIYRTTNAAGDVVDASGLLALPRNSTPTAVVSYQHGTSTRRSDVPSTASSQEGLLAAAIFAGHGHVLVAPDYVGLGQSSEPHAYLDAETAARNTVDLLRAARSIARGRGIEWPAPLFLTGFSQGGQATVATQRLLECAPIGELRVSASAPIAGPYQILEISFPHALAGTAPSHSLYLGYLSQAYARVHGQPLSSVLREPWAARIPALFDGTHDGQEISATLPARPRDLYRADFLEHYEAGGQSWYTRALAQNQVHSWRPRAPLRLYYGNLDLDVSPEDSLATAAHMQALGADVEAVSVGDFDHDGSVLPAAIQIRTWFDEVRDSMTR